MNMKKIKGITIIESVIALVVILALGTGGWYAYSYYHKKNASNNGKKNVKTTTSTSASQQAKGSQSADSYASWKTYTAKSEGLSFKYPANWQLTQATQKNQAGQNYTAVSLISPSHGTDHVRYIINFDVNGQPISMEKAKVAGKVLKAIPLNVTNSRFPLYAVIYDFNNTGRAQGIYLTDQSNPAVGSTSSIVALSQKNQREVIEMVAELVSSNTQKNSTAGPSYTLAQYTSDPNYQTVIKIYNSLAYAN